MDADSEQTKTGDTDDEESPDAAVESLDDKVVKRFQDVADGKVDDIEERLELLRIAVVGRWLPARGRAADTSARARASAASSRMQNRFCGA